jgi:hypothetical protein
VGFEAGRLARRDPRLGLAWVWLADVGRRGSGETQA